MADEADLANAELEQLLSSALRAPRAQTGPSARGRCHNCDEALSILGQLFCDRDCEHDWRKRTHRALRAGQAAIPQ